MNNNREKTEIKLLIEKRIKELKTELSFIEIKHILKVLI